MNRQQLFEQIKAKRSFLCVGLDTDINKIPAYLKEGLFDEPKDISRFVHVILQFNRAIIDATAPYTVAYKPNLAFYDAWGHLGMEALAATCVYIEENYPGIFIIADAKRGDIGNTSEMYAYAFFNDKAPFDAVTLSP